TSRIRSRSSTLTRPGIRVAIVAGMVAAIAMGYQYLRHTPERGVPAPAAASGLASPVPSPAFEPAPVPPAPPAVPAMVRWHPETVFEGSVFAIFIEGGDPSVRSATGTFGGEPLHFQPGG